MNLAALLTVPPTERPDRTDELSKAYPLARVGWKVG